MGYVFAVVSAILFSTKAIAIKLIYAEHVATETMLALRMLLALPFYVTVGIVSLRDRAREGRPLPSLRLTAAAAGTGLIGYWLGSYLDFLGLQYVSAQVERLILFTYPIFVVLFGTMFFGHKMTFRVIVAIVISYVGLAIVFTQSAITGGDAVVFGGLLVLASAIGSAFNQLFSKSLIDAIGPRLFTCISTIAAALAAFVQFFLTHPPRDLAVSPRVWGLALFLALGATVIPSFMFASAIHRISVQAAVTIGTLSPVATIVLAYLLLGEQMSLVSWFGTALVLAGVGWFTLADQMARRKSLPKKRA